jgi:hypothetical protein
MRRDSYSNTIGICGICQEEHPLLGHHLSYEPEIVIQICQKCHSFLHFGAKRPRDKLYIYFDLITTYGDNWENGIEKYKKSDWYRHRQKRNGVKDRKLNGKWNERYPDAYAKQKKSRKEKYDSLPQEGRRKVNGYSKRPIL